MWVLVLIPLVVIVVFLVNFGIINITFPYPFKPAVGTHNLDAYAGIGNGAPIGCPNDFTLGDYYMASSGMSVYAGKSAYDYVYSKSVSSVMKGGARLVDLHVYEVNKKPVVGYADSKTKKMYSYNTVPFEECCLAIANTAFDIGTPGSKNPFVLSIMFHTQSNTLMTDCAEVLKTTLRKFMLPSEYSYSRKDLAIEPVCKLMGKLIVVSGKETKGNGMEEMVNMTWGTGSLRRVSFTQATQTYDAQGDTDYNRRKITMVVPDDDKTDLTNKNAELCFAYGCQWVAMNYGDPGVQGGPMDTYVGKFMESPFALKPEPLRFKAVKEIPVTIQDPALAIGPKSIETPILSATIRPIDSPNI
jgi:hypothetical protein